MATGRMAEVLKPVLRHFKEKIRLSRHTDDGNEDIHLLVVSIHRYLVDPKFARQTGLDVGQQTDVYDLVLTDLQLKTKCLLSPECNVLAQTNQLRAGRVICVKYSQCSLHYDELDMHGEAFIIINSLSLLASTAVDGHQPDTPYCTDSGETEKADSPLVTGRGCYLPLWNSQDPYISHNQTEDLPTVADINRNTCISVERLADEWKALAKPYPSLLIRILHRARLMYYGKPNKTNKWPYQLHMEVADGSGACTATAWNQMALKLFNSVPDGTILLIQNYTVKSRFQLLTRPVVRNSDLDLFNIEVSLNPHNPACEVQVVSPTAVRPQWNLPDLKYQFCTRRQLSSLPEHYNCDVVGMVTYVSRYERIQHGSEGNEFWLRRWVHIMDRTSPQPAVLELYATSQPNVHDLIKPGRLLICTQMRLVHSLTDVTSSRQPRHLYLTTTCHSQLYVHNTENVSGPYASTTALDDVLSWRRSMQGQRVLLQNAAVGGYCPYPPLPCSLDTYTARFPQDTPMQLVASDQVLQEVEKLCYCEHRRIHTQGFLMYVRYQPLIDQDEQVSSQEEPGGSQEEPGGSQEETGRSQENGEQLEEEIPSLQRTLRSGKQLRTLQDTSISSKHQPNNHLKRKRRKDFSSKKVVEFQERLIDDLWQLIIDKVPSFRLRRPDPSFFTRVVRKQHFNVVEQHFTLQSNVLTPSKQNINLTDLPTKEKNTGYFILGIAGVNHQVALQVLFPAPSTLTSQNATLQDILCGRKQAALPTSVDGAHTGLTDQIIQHLLESSQELKNKRLVFVLDLYNSGRGQTEVVVNRAFPVGQ